MSKHDEIVVARLAGLCRDLKHLAWLTEHGFTDEVENMLDLDGMAEVAEQVALALGADAADLEPDSADMEDFT